MPGSSPAALPGLAAGPRTTHVETEVWRRLVRAARAGVTDGIAGIAARHLDAPVRALLVTASRGAGVRSRLTVAGGQTLIAAQRLATVAGETQVEPGARITVTDLDDVWGELAPILPDTYLMRAPAAVAAVGAVALAPGDAERLLGQEHSTLRVQVDAWGGSDRPVRTWDHRWAVVEDRLIELHLDGDDLRPVQRPAGSVARELRRTLAEAVDAAVRTGATR